MKKNRTLFILCLSAIAVCSCGRKCLKPSGKVITQNRSFNTYNSLSVKGLFEVTLIQDTIKGIQITADENYMPAITTQLDGNVLEIKEEGKCEGDPIKLTIHVQQLKDLDLSGSISLKTAGTIKLDDMELNLAGRVDADMDVNAHDIETNGAGNVELKMKGQASSHSVNLAGNGKLEAFDLVTARYDVTAAGATDIKINVLNELNVKSMGSGDVVYKGNPGKISQDIKGSGKVEKVK